MKKPINITNILINFKIFIKQVYQKNWTQNLKKKEHQNNYFKAEISQKGGKTTYT